MNILIIAPHPDDEVLGCGGTIKKYARKGHNVYVCIVTNGHVPEWPKAAIDNKLKEVKKAHKILEVKKTFFLDFPTVKLDSVLQKDLNVAILKIISKIKPKIVFIPHFGDLHKDHRLIHEAALVVARPLASNSVKELFAYETLSETEWGLIPFVFTPTVYENVESTMKYKLEAMAAYGSELRDFPHPRSLETIEALAKKRGSEAGFRRAEAFMPIRLKRN